MNALTTATLTLQSLPDRAIQSALTGLAPHSRRVYGSRIQAWLGWAGPEPVLDREHVNKYMRSLESQGRSAQVRNQSLAALKRLASEAADLGWIDYQTAVQVRSIKSKRITGVRTGRWLNPVETARLLASPDHATVTGRRDAAVLALLLGCGLRRAEACAIAVDQVKTSRDRTIITNLAGKGGRVRSVTVPTWAAQTINEWAKEII